MARLYPSFNVVGFMREKALFIYVKPAKKGERKTAVKDPKDSDSEMLIYQREAVAVIIAKILCTCIKLAALIHKVNTAYMLVITSIHIDLWRYCATPNIYIPNPSKKRPSEKGVVSRKKKKFAKSTKENKAMITRVRFFI